MDLSLIINRRAGGFENFIRLSGTERIVTAFHQEGHTLTVTIVDGETLESALRDSLNNADIHGIIMGGGDGTVRSAIAAGAGRDKPLGVLPLGTLNLLARDLGLPLDVFRAAQKLAKMRIADIDVCDVNGQPFAIWASLGLHPWITVRRDRLQRKDGLGHWRAFALAGLQVLRRYPLLRITATINGQNRKIVSPVVVVSNNAWNPEGAAFSPLSRTSLDHNELVLHVARTSSRLSLLWLALNALLGRWNVRGLLDTLTAQDVQVSSPRSRMTLSLDGEVLTMTTPLSFTCHHKALRVMIPAPEGRDANHSPPL